MPRPRLISEDRFRRRYHEAKDTTELAGRLGISMTSVYNYLARFQLPPKQKHRDRYDLDLIWEDVKNKSIIQIAGEHGVSVGSIQRALERAYYQFEPKCGDLSLPLPATHQLYAVLRHLQDDPYLLDDSQKLADLTGTLKGEVDVYIRRTFKHNADRAEPVSDPRSSLPRTAKRERPDPAKRHKSRARKLARKR